ncbi:hypothetical protein [Pseudomonas sp. NPDC090208]|uniref:hypothetical protein n=1 Tax=Pseudomonas sp. NPDC090208 TaxID=3364478 RepID=UPI0038155B9A
MLPTNSEVIGSFAKWATQDTNTLEEHCRTLAMRHPFFDSIGPWLQLVDQLSRANRNKSKGAIAAHLVALDEAKKVTFSLTAAHNLRVTEH